MVPDFVIVITINISQDDVRRALVLIGNFMNKHGNYRLYDLAILFLYAFSTLLEHNLKHVYENDGCFR